MRSNPLLMAALIGASVSVGTTGPLEIPYQTAPPRKRAPTPPARELSPDDKAALARAEDKRARKAAKRLCDGAQSWSKR